mmetsp:Transcript_8004/g.24097  ORF Transcript_8004/g.24097 Transcript_8004/m.24097 type:complete len:607 (-) Transcript_8004:1750-3570(-)
MFLSVRERDAALFEALQQLAEQQPEAREAAVREISRIDSYDLKGNYDVLFSEIFTCDWSHRVRVAAADALAVSISYNRERHEEMPLHLMELVDCEKTDLRSAALLSAVARVAAASRGGGTPGVQIFLWLADRCMQAEAPPVKVQMLRAMCGLSLESLSWPMFYETISKKTTVPSAVKAARQGPPTVRKTSIERQCKLVVRGVFSHAAEHEKAAVRITTAHSLADVYAHFHRQKAPSAASTTDTVTPLREQIAWQNACEEAVVSIYADLLMDDAEEVVFASLKALRQLHEERVVRQVPLLAFELNVMCVQALRTSGSFRAEVTYFCQQLAHVSAINVDEDLRNRLGCLFGTADVQQLCESLSASRLLCAEALKESEAVSVTDVEDLRELERSALLLGNDRTFEDVLNDLRKIIGRLDRFPSTQVEAWRLRWKSLQEGLSRTEMPHNDGCAALLQYWHTVYPAISDWGGLCTLAKAEAHLNPVESLSEWAPVDEKKGLALSKAELSLRELPDHNVTAVITLHNISAHTLCSIRLIGKQRSGHTVRRSMRASELTFGRRTGSVQAFVDISRDWAQSLRVVAGSEEYALSEWAEMPVQLWRKAETGTKPL